MTAADNYVTVKEVVRLSRFSERTVRADIARGELPIVRQPNGRIMVPRAVLMTGYGHAGWEKGELLSIREFCNRVTPRISERTFRRQLARWDYGPMVVKMSPHRLFIRRSVAQEWGWLPPSEEWPEMPGRYLLGVREVAEFLGISKRAVYHAIEKGALAKHSDPRGRRIKVLKSEVRRYAGLR